MTTPWAPRPGMGQTSTDFSSPSSDQRAPTPLQSVISPSKTTGIPPPGLTPQKAPPADQKQESKEELTDMEKFGLRGLLSLIRGEPSDQNTVALGTDVGLLGLDMSQRSLDEKLSKSFASPWVETSRSEVEPQFDSVPEFKCEVPPVEDKLTLFSEETLFYLFYTRPRDQLQEACAKELMNRNWRYHKELQVWLTKDTNSEPVQQSVTTERGIYVFFDPTTWSKVKKEFLLNYNAILS